MNFNSFSYYLFLPLSVFLYFILPAKWRNPALLLLSYFFYMCWNPRYSLLILTSTAITYACALLMEKHAARRRLWLIASLALNLLILFFFKYFNFAAALLNSGLAALELPARLPAVSFLLPVGISFYTFQALGYTMDVYRGNIVPEKNFIDYALFVSFFPQLVAGPIERSTNLLPQFKPRHSFSLDKIFAGALLFLWGLFKKLVIADRLAVLVNFAFAAAPGEANGWQYMAAASAFSIQIYCDFSAYSDIARGSARMLGFELMRNFDAPYLAASIKDFWRRWHISLSSWFRDYLYFPLGGSRCKAGRAYLNLLIIFVISGLWHGAALTFVLWGFLHGMFMIISSLTAPWRDQFLKALRISSNSRIVAACRVLFNFALVTAAFVFFRAGSFSHALYMLKTIVLLPWAGLTHSGITLMGLPQRYLAVLLLAIIGLFTVDALARKRDLVQLVTRGVWPKYAVYFALLALIFIFGYYGAAYDPQDFIYFRF